MTTIIRDEASPELDAPAGVLAAILAERAAADAAEARLLALAVDWAAMHPPESVDACAGWSTTPVGGCEQVRRLAGPGTPPVAEFCVADLGVALRCSVESARSYLADAIELAHRLPATYARVVAGDLPAWRARRVAQRTTTLAVRAAAWVDRHVAPSAHRLGPAALDRAVDDAIARFDPDLATERAAVAADGRHLDIDLRALSFSGTVEIRGCVDLSDGLDLELALQQGAESQLALGSDLSLDQRRARAAGDLARRQLSLDLVGGDARGDRGGARRRVVLHVHLSHAALTGRVLSGQAPAAPVTVRAAGTGDVLALADQARAWCEGAAVTVVPVVDLAAQVVAEPGTDRIGAHLDRLVRLRDRHCVFPHCHRSSESCDIDHVVATSDGGPTASSNLAPLCRFHHRLKTHGRWRYEVLDTGLYRWVDPRGEHHLVDVRPHAPPDGG